VRRAHHLLIGEESAERIKIEAGTAAIDTDASSAEIHIRGRDLRSGQPKGVVLGSANIAEALRPPIELLAEFIQRALEDLPPEVSRAIGERGIHLTGGGALLDKLEIELERRVGIKFMVPDEPMRCVIKGTAAVLEQMEQRSHLLIGA